MRAKRGRGRAHLEALVKRLRDEAVEHDAPVRAPALASCRCWSRSSTAASVLARRARLALSGSGRRRVRALLPTRALDPAWPAVARPGAIRRSRPFALLHGREVRRRSGDRGGGRHAGTPGRLAGARAGLGLGLRRTIEAGLDVDKVACGGRRRTGEERGRGGDGRAQVGRLPSSTVREVMRPRWFNAARHAAGRVRVRRGEERVPKWRLSPPSVRPRANWVSRVARHPSQGLTSVLHCTDAR